MDNRYICIHGHFYQPPRENPWLDDVELQDSAYPYHDWNERITAECYAPNAASRIFDGDGRILAIVNNYARMSFNFGPTLLSWMEKHAGDTYRLILQADRESRERFSGHGSAIAQIYNHMIMPLANERDKRTQIVWAIRDFEYRFRRKPEGMWLPETAADVASLEVLAEYEIRFTILSPHQAKAVRGIGEEDWHDVSGGKIDPKMPYLCRLPSGRSIALFFYDGYIAQEASFGNALDNGEYFANRLASTFDNGSDRPQLVHIATDGETYSHHHRYGDMALAYCMYYLEKHRLANVTIYGEYLEKFPLTREVQIVEPSSWSCSHGVQRWQGDCGCRAGGNLQWKQDWRKYLRESMDWLRDSLAPLFEKRAARYVKDPWAMRDDYISVILDRSMLNVEAFLARNASRPLLQGEKIELLKLMAMQRCALLMYTSCGWFFDELSATEPVQNMLYAARAMQLAREVSCTKLDPAYIQLLEQAPSNIPEFRNGAVIYEKFVKPSVVDLYRVAAHFAVSCLFQKQEEITEIYAYTANLEDYDAMEAGEHKLSMGRARVRSDQVWEECVVDFAILYFGGHNLNGAVRSHAGQEAFSRMHEELTTAFGRGDIAEVIRLMNQHFGTGNYSLRHLFKDEQKKLVNQILQASMEGITTTFRQIYAHHYSIMLALKEVGIPLPAALVTPAEYVLNTELCSVLEEEAMDSIKLHRLVKEAKKWSFELDGKTLSYVAAQRINLMMQMLVDRPDDLHLLETIHTTFDSLRFLPLELNLWAAQNAYFTIASRNLQPMRLRAKQGDPLAKAWGELFGRLGQQLKVRTE